MQTVTPAQKDALAGTTTRLLRVDVEEPDGTIVASTEEAVGQQLYVNSGSVTADGSADVQRTVRMTLADPDGSLVPTESNDLLHPLSGRQIRVRAGVRTTTRASLAEPPVNTDHLWQLGVFLLMSADVARSTTGLSISLEADDRSARVKDNAWPEGRYRARENYAPRLTWILEQAYPGAEYRWAPATVTVPNKWFGIDGRNDRLADLRATARRAGMRLIVDAGGTFATVAVQDPQAVDPTWLFSADEAHNLTSVGRSLSRRETYNVVVLDVESTEKPATGETSNFRVYAKIADDRDPLWIGGPLGRRTLRERATKPMKVADAQAAVEARLREVRRTTETIQFSGLVNPALEVFDVVGVEDPISGTVDAHLLERFTYDFLSGTMQAETSERRVSA